MITIEGNAARRGVAIAVTTIVDTLKGISGISPVLLQEGVNALRRGAEPNDFPEVVVFTDSLAIGAAVRIPGVRTIGIAAQSAEMTPGIEPDIPCVTGLPDLLPNSPTNLSGFANEVPASRTNPKPSADRPLVL